MRRLIREPQSPKALAAAAGWFWLSGEVSGSRGAAVTQSVTIEKGSGPLAIGQTLIQDGPMLMSALWVTLKITFLSFALAVVLTQLLCS